MLERFFIVWHRVIAKPNAWFQRHWRPVRRAYWTASVKLRSGAWGPGLRVNGPTVVTHNVHIGQNCHFNGMYVHGGARVDIGDNFHSAPGLKILTINHNYERGTALPYDATIVEKPVSIGANVWIGEGVIVTPGAQIGEGVVVAAGSVVSGRVEDLAVVGGNPARVLKHRDAQHYYKLKAEGKFI